MPRRHRSRGDPRGGRGALSAAVRAPRCAAHAAFRRRVARIISRVPMAQPRPASTALAIAWTESICSRARASRRFSRAGSSVRGARRDALPQQHDWQFQQFGEPDRVVGLTDDSGAADAVHRLLQQGLGQQVGIGGRVVKQRNVHRGSHDMHQRPGRLLPRTRLARPRQVRRGREPRPPSPAPRPSGRSRDRCRHSPQDRWSRPRYPCR